MRKFILTEKIQVLERRYYKAATFGTCIFSFFLSSFYLPKLNSEYYWQQLSGNMFLVVEMDVTEKKIRRCAMTGASNDLF
jgi:hypothetical protein